MQVYVTCSQCGNRMEIPADAMNADLRLLIDSLEKQLAEARQATEAAEKLLTNYSDIALPTPFAGGDWPTGMRAMVEDWSVLKRQLTGAQKATEAAVAVIREEHAWKAKQRGRGDCRCHCVWCEQADAIAARGEAGK